MVFLNWEYDPEYNFNYDDLNEEEKYTFQAIQNGAYDISIQRVHAALYVIASKGILKNDIDWWAPSKLNKIAMHLEPCKPNDSPVKGRYIIVICYEKHVEIINEHTDNKIVVNLNKNAFTKDTDNIVEAILSV